MKDNKVFIPFVLSSYESNSIRSSNPHIGCHEATTSKTLHISELNLFMPSGRRINY